MDNRIKLHNILKGVTPNVYFQPPSTMSIQYPAIVYTRKSINNLNANNDVYGRRHSYNVTVVDRNPDSPTATKVMGLKYCKFDRQYVSEGINHIVFVINY